MRVKFLFCACLFAGMIAVADESVKDSEGLPLVILLGDSIRMNYQSAVVENLVEEAEVWAPKENCAHTAFTLENLDRWLEGKNPEVIHINVGLHDMFLNAKTGKPRHTLETYEANLRAIFTQLKQLSEAKIVFALTTAVNEANQDASKGYGRVVRRNSDVEVYNATARKVAKESGVAVNDLHAFMKEAGPGKILRPSDGIHLSPEGCERMGAEVARVIRVHLAK